MRVRVRVGVGVRARVKVRVRVRVRARVRVRVSGEGEGQGQCQGWSARRPRVPWPRPPPRRGPSGLGATRREMDGRCAAGCSEAGGTAPHAAGRPGLGAWAERRGGAVGVLWPHKGVGQHSEAAVVPPGSFQLVLRRLSFSRTQSTSPFGLMTRPPQPTTCVAKAGTGHGASVGSQRRSIAWHGSKVELSGPWHRPTGTICYLPPEAAGLASCVALQYLNRLRCGAAFSVVKGEAMARGDRSGRRVLDGHTHPHAAPPRLTQLVERQHQLGLERIVHRLLYGDGGALEACGLPRQCRRAGAEHPPSQGRR